MAITRTLGALTLGIILLSCDKEQLTSPVEHDSIIVDFNYQLVGDCSTPTLEVFLENKTLNAKSYLWDFGDGTISNQENPRKVYPKSGDYSIKLIAYFSDNTVQVEKSIIINRNSDGTGPSGKISITNRNATNLELTFEIATDATSYLLDFGDGSPRVSTSEKVIKHQYTGLGLYNVSMLIQNSDGCNCVDTTIVLRP